MPNRSTETLLTALGFSRATGRLYERLLIQDGRLVSDTAAVLDLPVETLLERMAPLLEAGAVNLIAGAGGAGSAGGDRIQVRPPADLVAMMIRVAADAAEQANERVVEIAEALPLLTLTAEPPGGFTVGEPLDGEVLSDARWVEHTRTLVRSSVGDILWLRPDQWRQDWEPEMNQIVADALAAGRRVRAIYPVRVLAEAPEVLRRRAELGEEIRLLPEVPTRMVVLGTAHAVLPEPVGFSPSPRTHVRQAGWVELARLYFEQLWAQASPISEATQDGSDGFRRFLLTELAGGAQDEQIARRLGLSLRTVRRRVAELLVELGAASRFQAGVEAGRRGWL